MRQWGGVSNIVILVLLLVIIQFLALIWCVLLAWRGSLPGR